MTRRLALIVIAACTLATPLMLPAHASATTQLDQQTGVDTGRAGEPLYAVTIFGQVFTTGITGSLSSASAYLRAIGTPSLTQQLYAVDPGTSVPTGAALASEAIILGPTTWTWVETTFTAPVSVTAGTQYALVILSTDSGGSGIDAEWARGLAYSGGTGVYGTGGTWLQFTGGQAGDMAFRTYVTTTDPATNSTVAGPAEVMQQVGTHGTSSCADVDESALAFGSEVHGGWSKSWAQWANDGAGGSVCTRTLTYEVNTSRWSVG